MVLLTKDSGEVHRAAPLGGHSEPGGEEVVVVWWCWWWWEVVEVR